jgi:hypothetical protein
MNKTLIVFIAILGILIVVGSYFGYQYWEKGAPEYSFQQLQGALKNHDTSAFNKYYDAGAISNNIWPRIKSKYLEYYSTMSSSGLVQGIALSQLDNMEKTFKESFKNSFYGWARGGSGEFNANPETKITIVAGFLDSKPVFKTRADGTVSADFTYQNSAPKNLQLNFIFEQQKDRQWKIIDVQGFEDFFTADLGKEQSKSRDTRRLADIKQLQLALELYFDYPNSKYPNSLFDLSPKIIPSIPKDPLTKIDYYYCKTSDTNYHLGADLEDSNNNILQHDIDKTDNACISGTPFSGSDVKKCNGYVGGSCYDTDPGGSIY